MADDHEVADVVVDDEVEVQKTHKSQRAYRVDLGVHDTPKAKTEEIIALAKSALESAPAEHSHKDVATALKRKLDDKYKSTWHVIVGTHFGGNVTNDAESLVNFKLDELSFLVLRSGPPHRPHTGETDAAEETS